MQLINLQYVKNRSSANTELHVTELAYKGNDGTNIIESSWFNVTAWEGKDISDFGAITHGAIVHITGRLKCNRYMDGNGNDRVQYEIVARKLEIVKEDRV